MKLSGQAKLAGVIGYPVAHSLSPRLHGYWLEYYGIDGAYIPMTVKPQDLAECLRILPKLGFRGCNLTVPHKEAAVALMDEVEEHARRIGAVNTVIIEQDGRLFGRNTDGLGFLENILVNAPTWLPPSGPVTVIGAGGAARAILVALMDAGVPEIRLVNRTAEKAEKLSQELGADVIRVWPWQKRSEALEDITLLVNSTTLGMNGQPPLDLSLDRLPHKAVVNDIVYAPLKTPLLAAAVARGHTVVDGLGMLLYQAVPGFFAWFRQEPEVTDRLRQRVLEGLQ
tara:strand:- start:14802 stop:15650 length:849 start_codon:yes stop_codon:yes gene_type:complete